MSIVTDKIASYNRRALEKYGWTPWHLSLDKDATDQQIYDKILEFQFDCIDLVNDGLLGPMTHRRMETFSFFNESNSYPTSVGFVLIGGSPVPVDFKTKMPSSGSSFSLIGAGGHGMRPEGSSPTSVVWHWDAALNGASCHRILKKRKVSSHGVIDNDGTFIQFLDFKEHVGWHAGNSKVNKASIGIDISNAVYTKYNSWYKKHQGKERPIIEAEVHGHDYQLLGYYEEQIETARRLSILIKDQFQIPLKHPHSNTVIESPDSYNGHLAHFHIKKTKWDVAGFPFDRVLYDDKDVC